MLAQAEAAKADFAAAGIVPANALERVFTDERAMAGPNVFPTVGLPSAFGYWFPTRRALELFASIQREPLYTANHVLEPTAGPADAGTRALSMLYDVRAWRHRGPEGGAIIPLPTLGAAWFPKQWIGVADGPALGEALRARAAAPRALRDDAIFGPGVDAPPAPIEDGCGDGRALVSRTIDGGQRIELDVASPARCVLVVSTNFTSRLEATFVTHQGIAARVPVMPVDGSLLGVSLPKGEGKLVIEPVLHPQRWGAVLRVIGWIACVLAALSSVALRVRAR
jgi:hypothetical protein